MSMTEDRSSDAGAETADMKLVREQAGEELPS